MALPAVTAARSGSMVAISSSETAISLTATHRKAAAPSVSATGTASVSLGSTLAYNRAQRGGAVWVGQSGRFFSDSGLSIVNNAAAGTGGGIFNQGTVQDSSVPVLSSETQLAEGAAGIMSRGGTVILESGGLRVANNSAAGGGGIFATGGRQLDSDIRSIRRQQSRHQWRRRRYWRRPFHAQARSRDCRV